MYVSTHVARIFVYVLLVAVNFLFSCVTIISFKIKVACSLHIVVVFMVYHA
jgi:hypothetical protein